MSKTMITVNSMCWRFWFKFTLQQKTTKIFFFLLEVPKFTPFYIYFFISSYKINRRNKKKKKKKGRNLVIDHPFVGLYIITLLPISFLIVECSILAVFPTGNHPHNHNNWPLRTLGAIKLMCLWLIFLLTLLANEAEPNDIDGEKGLLLLFACGATKFPTSSAWPHHEPGEKTMEWVHMRPHCPKRIIDEERIWGFGS